MDKLLQIGVITSTHGLKGEVKVFPTTDDPNRFKLCPDVILDPAGLNQPLKITGARLQKNQVIVKFREFDDISQVEGLKQKAIFVTREDAVPLEENENYIVDLIGLTVVTEDGQTLGKLTEVMETGANDVYVVDLGAKELLIPAIRDCILDVNLEEEKMTVHLLKGML